MNSSSSSASFSLLYFPPLPKKARVVACSQFNRYASILPLLLTEEEEEKGLENQKVLFFLWPYPHHLFPMSFHRRRKREIYNSQSIYMGGITCVSQEEEGLGCSVGNVRALLAAESRWVHVPRHFSSPLRLQLDANVCNLTLCLLTRMRPHPNNNNKTEKTPFSVPPPPDSFQISFDCWRLMIFLTSPLDGALALERAIRCGIHDRVHSHAATTSSPFLLQTALSLSLSRPCLDRIGRKEKKKGDDASGKSQAFSR